MLPYTITTKDEWLALILAKTVRSGECLLYTGCIDAQGYGVVYRPVRIKHLIERKQWLAHRAVYYLRHGVLTKWVLHTCDVRNCVEDTHHFEGTQVENMADAARKGRMPKGEQHYTNKLSDAEVAFIRKYYSYGMGVKFAVMFGVSHQHISRIVHNKERL